MPGGGAEWVWKSLAMGLQRFAHLFGERGAERQLGVADRQRDGVGRVQRNLLDFDAEFDRHDPGDLLFGGAAVADGRTLGGPGGVGVDGDLFFRESGQDRAARHAEDDRGRGVFPQKRFLD